MKILALINLLFIASCVHVPAKEMQGNDPPIPKWVTNLPQSAGLRYFVGESHGATNKEDALERAWVSSFVRMGMTEFPETGQIKTESFESLKSAEYQRKFVMRLEMVDWTGIREATELGSPFVAQEVSGGYTVYRLLRWQQSDINSAHEKIKSAKKFELPRTPEGSQTRPTMGPDRLVAYLSRPETFKAFSYDQIKKLPKIREGMTKAEVLASFGRPEAVRPNVRMPHHGFWGTSGQAFVYKGEMCNERGTSGSANMFVGHSGLDLSSHECAVGLAGGEVVYIENFHYLYTEELE